MSTKDYLLEAGYWLAILLGVALLATQLLVSVALVGHDIGWW